MWKRLLELGARLFSLSQKLQQHEDQIKAVQGDADALSQRVDRLTEALQRVTFELQRTKENAAHDREKLLLQLENALLRFERRLPPVAPDQEVSAPSLAALPGHSVTDPRSESGLSGPIVIWRLIACHEREYAERVVDWCRREGVLAVGWGLTGPLGRLQSGSRTELTRIVSQTHPASSTSNASHGGSSLWNLYVEMKPGDLVIVSTGTSRALTLQVAGEYCFVPGEYPPYYEHRRKAKAVPIHPEYLWRLSGGAAPGQNIRLTLMRCARTLTDAEFSELVQ